MSPVIYSIEKSLSERLEEYKLFLIFDPPVPFDQIKCKWSGYLETEIPIIQWRALWKIPRPTCEEMRIPLGTAVYVMVVNIDFKALSATIRIDEDYVDVVKHELMEVQLKSLVPTILQENSDIDVQNIALKIDQLRFFYNNIFHPWDEDLKNTVLTIPVLESRFQLLQDMNSALIPYDMCQEIRKVMDEGRRVAHEMKNLRCKLENCNELKAEITCDLEFMKIKLHQLEAKIERYESKYLRPCYDLDLALKKCSVGDKVLLSPGEFNINDCETLSDGGEIRGIYKEAPSKLAFIGNTRNLFSWYRGLHVLKNLHINFKGLSGISCLMSAELTMINCKIEGGDEKSMFSGIATSSWLDMEDCAIIGFNVGLLVFTNGSVNMKMCDISLCNFGIQVHDKGSLRMESCSVSHSDFYGIKIEDQETEEEKIIIKSSHKTMSCSYEMDLIEINNCYFHDNHVDVIHTPN